MNRRDFFKKISSIICITLLPATVVINWDKSRRQRIIELIEKRIRQTNKDMRQNLEKSLFSDYSHTDIGLAELIKEK